MSKNILDYNFDQNDIVEASIKGERINFLKELGEDRYYNFLELIQCFLKEYTQEYPHAKEFTLNSFIYTLEDHLY